MLFIMLWAGAMCDLMFNMCKWHVGKQNCAFMLGKKCIGVSMVQTHDKIKSINWFLFICTFWRICILRNMAWNSTNNWNIISISTQFQMPSFNKYLINKDLISYWNSNQKLVFRHILCVLWHKHNIFKWILDSIVKTNTLNWKRLKARRLRVLFVYEIAIYRCE